MLSECILGLDVGFDMETSRCKMHALLKSTVLITGGSVGVSAFFGMYRWLRADDTTSEVR